MTVFGIALRSLRQRALATVLTAVSVALGVALVFFVFGVRDTASGAFRDAARGYDVVLGGKHTSPLTTVLSTIFYADQPTDRIPIEAYEAVRAHENVAYAIPFAVGDVYQGWRVAGTTADFFDAIEDSGKRPLRDRVRGRVFSSPEAFEAVVGGIASVRTGLVLGARFRVSHGMEKGGPQHAEEWTVVGVLEPTGTPNDRAIFITLEAFFAVTGHERPDAGMAGAEPPGHDEDEHAPWAVSSIVVRLKRPAERGMFIEAMNQRPDLQAALPAREIPKLIDAVRNVETLARSIAWAVLAISGLATFVGLYNTIQGRRRELAILRALGARRLHVFSVVVLEAVLTCLFGGLAGIALGHARIAVVAPYFLGEYGVRIAPSPGLPELQMLVVLLGMGVLVGLLPAWRAFRVPVAENLHPID